MPVLCVYTDLSSISLLLYKSPTEFWFKTFPYIYSKHLFSSSFDETSFYRSLFQSFCSEQDIKVADCSVIMTGFLEPPKLAGIDVKLYVSLLDIVTNIEGCYPIIVNNWAIFTKDYCLSNTTTVLGDTLDTEETNYYANLEMYPQIISTELPTQIDIDSNISALLTPVKLKVTNDLPVVFAGSRFNGFSIFPELEDLLMLDLLKQPGFYNIKRDKANQLVLATLLKLYKSDVEIDYEIPFEGVVISSNNSLECMLTASDDVSQLIQLEKDKIFIVPVAEGDRVKVMIKSVDLGTVEKTLHVGGVGIVFDTRQNKSITAKDIKGFSEGLKVFKTAKGNLN